MDVTQSSIYARDNYKDNYYGSILDPLHGDIKLSEIEKWCISQPIFARLRRVKQNTFLFYVFPSANHTRFEHSIGVMHLAGKIFDACKDNYATGKKKSEKYSEREQSSFFNLGQLRERQEIYYQELRLAALLHDLGHGPLSHLFDEFAISGSRFLTLIQQSKTLNNYSQGFQDLIKSNGDKAEHEAISCAFIFYLIDRLKRKAIEDPHKFSDSTSRIIESISAERIVKIIEPEFTGLIDEIKDDSGNDYALFFSRIVTAFPIDADRMDYLLRDSYFSGVTYGIYDINRIFSSFFAAQRKTGVIELAIKESGLDSILRFIQSRTHLYNQVYFHKTNRAANTMLSFCTASRRKADVKLLDACQDMAELREFYKKNSDEHFIFYTVNDNLVTKGSVEEQVHNDLLNRRLFKRVFQSKVVLVGNQKEKKERVKFIRDEINIKLNDLASQGIIATADYYDNVTFKDSDKKVILVANKNQSGHYEFAESWKDLNAEFRMADITVCMIRIYLKRCFDNPNTYKLWKKTINDHVAGEIKELCELADLNPNA